MQPRQMTISDHIIVFNASDAGVMTSRRKSLTARRHRSDYDAILTKRPRYDSMENGKDAASQHTSDTDLEGLRLGHHNWIDQTEYIRLIVQSLNDMGYTDIASRLETESQIKHEEQNVVALRRAVDTGDWDEALKVLNSIPLETDVNRRRAQFLLLEEKFLEAVERREWKTALSYLRVDMAPLSVNTDRLHALASCLLCPNVDDLRAVAKWEGPCIASRHRVLRSLQEIIPAHVMLPQGRLVKLLDQAIQSQMDSCLFHNSAYALPSLLVDYSAGMEQIPTEVAHELCDHSDEVWHVAFSNDGRSLASCSQDGVTIIWEVQSRDRIFKKLELVGHCAAVTYLSWSPDDKYLATTGQDSALKVWDTTSGECVLMITEHSEQVSSIGWMPDSKRFISGSNNRFLYMWNLEGKKLKAWKITRVLDLVVSKAGDRLITLGNDRKIHIFDLEGSDAQGIIECDTSISAITLSNDGAYLLASTQRRMIQLWELNHNLHGLQPKKPKKRYKLPELVSKDQKYIIRTCFGGHNEAFVLSGSEECKVYVWHKQSEKLVAALEGHSGVVNSVSWNPVDPTMFASVSDDKSVHIWTTKSTKSSNW